MKQGWICKRKRPPGDNEWIGSEIKVQRVVLKGDMRENCLLSATCLPSMLL